MEQLKISIRGEKGFESLAEILPAYMERLLEKTTKERGQYDDLEDFIRLI